MPPIIQPGSRICRSRLERTRSKEPCCARTRRGSETATAPVSAPRRSRRREKEFPIIAPSPCLFCLSPNLGSRGSCFHLLATSQKSSSALGIPTCLSYASRRIEPRNRRLGDDAGHRLSRVTANWLPRARQLAAKRAPSTLQRAFHQPLEEELLRDREGENARRHHDDIDRSKVRPRPLALAALGCCKDDGHRAPRFIVDERHAKQILAPGRHEVHDEDDHQAIAYHWQAHHPERAPVPGAVDLRGFDHLMRHELEHAA